MSRQLSAFTIPSGRRHFEWRLAPAQYVDVLRMAARPTWDLRDFGVALDGAMRARALELGARENTEWQAFAELLAVRIRNARRYLRDNTDSGLLSEFLAFAFEHAQEAIAGAETTDELVEVIASAIDGLHSYLAAHDLVGSAYFADDADYAAHLATEPNDEVAVVTARREDDPGESAANRSDLALAA